MNFIIISIKTKGLFRNKEYLVFRKIITEGADKFVYAKWICKDGFINFLKAVGEAPKEKRVYHDKIHPNKPYSPDNFIWKIKPIKRKYERFHFEAIIKFMLPIDVDFERAGIYKITFDNGCFYIGSTKNLWMRIGAFRSQFNGAGRLHNKKLIKCVCECQSVKFEVIEYINNVSDLKPKETVYISEHIGSDLLINRAYDAHSNKGVKWTDEERAKTKKTLIDKYNANEIKNPRGFFKRKYDPENLFKSKMFGDKE